MELDISSFKTLEDEIEDRKKSEKSGRRNGGDKEHSLGASTPLIEFTAAAAEKSPGAGASLLKQNQNNDYKAGGQLKDGDETLHSFLDRGKKCAYNAYDKSGKE